MRVVLAVLRERTDANADTIGALYGRDWLEMPEEGLARALAELLDPDFTLVPDAEGGVASAPRAGLDSALRLFSAAREDWVSCRYVADAIDEHGDEVLVSGRLVAEPRGSGPRASFSFAHAWTIRAGRVVRIAAYHGRAQARTALAWPAA